MAKNESVIYKGEMFTVLNTGRYYCSGRHKGKNAANERLLHRRIWTEHNGAIPPGNCIHHIDCNWRNNNIENLGCISSGDHQRNHMAERFKDGEYRIKNSQQLRAANDKAKSWHSSPEGVEWHKKHGKNVFGSIVGKEYECEECRKKFISRSSHGARTCSEPCRTKRNNRKAKTECTSTCLNCGTVFRHIKTPKGKPTRGCRRKCTEAIKKRCGV